MNRWLSIIVPTYNGAPYLSECLHSVLDQLPEDYELIVVGDGSKDDTKIILEGFAGRQSNHQVCFCSHKGVSGARNTGLSLAFADTSSFLTATTVSARGSWKPFARSWKRMPI